MKKIFRLTALALACILALGMFAACGKTANEESVKVHVTIYAGDSTLYDGDVDVSYATGEEPTVFNAVQRVMDTSELQIILDSEEEPTTIKDIGEYTDGDYFWEFRVNDTTFKDTRGQANTVEIREGDVIVWSYNSLEDTKHDHVDPDDTADTADTAKD